MDKAHKKFTSEILGRDMELDIYGYGGRPVLYIRNEDTRIPDPDNFRIDSVFNTYLDNGSAMVFSVNTVDSETWLDKDSDPAERVRLYESWIAFITDEIVPLILDTVNENTFWNGSPGIMLMGAGLGATHAVNLFFRRPDLFERLLALSGIYSAAYGFGDYMDDLVLMNSPVDHLRALADDDSVIGKYNSKKAVICASEGDFDSLRSTRELEDILKDKDINVWCDYWQQEVNYIWQDWNKKAEYFIPYLLY